MRNSFHRLWQALQSFQVIIQYSRMCKTYLNYLIPLIGHIEEVFLHLRWYHWPLFRMSKSSRAYCTFYYQETTTFLVHCRLLILTLKNYHPHKYHRLIYKLSAKWAYLNTLGPNTCLWEWPTCHNQSDTILIVKDFLKWNRCLRHLHTLEGSQSVTDPYLTCRQDQKMSVQCRFEINNQA